MTKRRPAQEQPTLRQRNPVAKLAHHYNKFQVFADKHRYARNAKHRNLESFAIVS